MKKIYLILAAITSAALYSCTSDEFVGNSPGVEQQSYSGEISFGPKVPAITRGYKYGADAASKLDNKFVVYGTKHRNGAEDNTADKDQVVFNNFQVEWTASTAGTTESNTSDWDYVGKTAYKSGISSQGIKYWDYSATNGYTFYAFSYHDDNNAITYPQNATNDAVVVNKTTSNETSLYNKGYAVTVNNGAELNNLYFSDRVEVPKTAYDKTVSFTFRNIGAKVRVGFYETIPGYTVKIDRFYIDNNTPTAPVTSFAAMNDCQTDGFYASMQNLPSSVDRTFNVTYIGEGTRINQPTVSNPSGEYSYALKIGDGTGIIGKALATSAASPTWVDGSNSGDYTAFYPFEGNTNPLLIKLDFTMTADDGSGDVINVRGARAVVPADYVKWKNNYAYTYIFKISDKTNGTTGAVDGNDDPITDPEGLKPITFDAIVVDADEDIQQTITSVSTNSITTYAKGVAVVNEYTTSDPIHIVVSNSATGAVIEPSGLGDTDGKAQVYKLNKAATEAEVLAQKTGSKMGITFTAESTTLETTIPLADGTTPSVKNVKFTPSSANTYYAYIYTTTAYEDPQYLNQSSGTYDSGKTYYMKTDNDVYYAVSVPSADAFAEHKAQLYIIDPDNAGAAGVYDVKIIKVQ